MNAPSALKSSTVLEELTEIIGADAARKMVENFSGQHVYVPAKIGHNHPISGVIGPKAAQVLTDNYRGETIVMPQAFHRRSKVMHFHKTTDMTINEIALATGYTVRHVYTILAEEGEDDGQLDLFTS